MRRNCSVSCVGELPPKRVQTLRAVQATGATSIYALAKHLKRNYSNVHTDVRRLIFLGLLEQDAAAGRPLQAVLCEARLANGLPALGFFAKALALGRFQDSDHHASVAAERALLFAGAPYDDRPATD